jgi:hypothetical protein
MTTMRAQEDSGIREELKTYGINKEKFYREKEIAAISVAASMLCVSTQIHSIKIWTFGHDRHATRKVTFLQRHHKTLYHFPKIFEFFAMFVFGPYLDCLCYLSKIVACYRAPKPK